MPPPPHLARLSRLSLLFSLPRWGRGTLSTRGRTPVGAICNGLQCGTGSPFPPDLTGRDSPVCPLPTQLRLHSDACGQGCLEMALAGAKGVFLANPLLRDPPLTGMTHTARYMVVLHVGRTESAGVNGPRVRDLLALMRRCSYSALAHSLTPPPTTPACAMAWDRRDLRRAACSTSRWRASRSLQPWL